MADLIRYDTMRIKTDAGRVEECITAVKKELRDLETSAQELDAMWDGEGSEAFKAVFHDDIEALMVFIIELESIYSYEIRAGKSFDKCTKAVADVLASM